MEQSMGLSRVVNLHVRPLHGRPTSIVLLERRCMDQVGNSDTYTVEVKLYNEMPTAAFTLERNGTASEDVIFFNGSSSADPENNPVSFEWWSNVDGTLMVGQGIENISWNGHLSRGVHQIELRITDDRMDHGGQMSVVSELITVDILHHELLSKN